MQIVNKLLRRPARALLKLITLAVIKKHKPTIVAILGDGHTSIARELIYQVLSAQHPVRRNLESPEAEFSVPLAILGYPNYPTNYYEWLKMVGKTTVQIFTIAPYEHFLVLELNSVKPDILKYWLEITTSQSVVSANTVVVIGKTPIEYQKYNFKKVIKIANNEYLDLLGPVKIAANEIGKFYKIDPKNIDIALNSSSLPPSKIRFLDGTNGSLVIDATHYYYPTNLEAVIELVSLEDIQREKSSLVIYSQSKEDQDILKKHSPELWTINPQNYTPRNNDVIILRGDRVKQLYNFRQLINSQIPQN